MWKASSMVLTWFIFLYRFCYVDQNEVARAIELREIVTSLGPAYIKLGQALSIRPDILSPAAMTELQKLCDKVRSYFDNQLSMQSTWNDKGNSNLSYYQDDEC